MTQEHFMAVLNMFGYDPVNIGNRSHRKSKILTRGQNSIFQAPKVNLVIKLARIKVKLFLD